jgi:copper chaperone CopZ
MKIRAAILIFFMGTILIMAQNKNQKLNFEVDGVCGMCKKRIEKAALGEKGVKYAQWDINSHNLTLIVDENKTNELKVKKAIALVGHDTKEIKATEEAYNSVAPCCKYRDSEVVESHHK